jgi:TolB-like protein
MNLKKYIAELKRRNVFKSGIAYLVVAWIIAEVADVVFPTFNAPAYFMKVLLIILIIGFPINLIFSWIYDITREGLKKTEGIDQEAQKSKLTGNRLNKVIIASLSVAVVLLVFNQFWKRPGNKEGKVENTEIIEAADVVEISIAVLPLYNMNQDEQLEYFSEGVTQEIIDELAKVNQFSLMAFSSTRKYKNTDKSSKDIAAELEVSLMLTGSSRIYGDSVRLSIELVNGGTGKIIWNKRYDDLFSNTLKIQNDIAKQVVAELKIELSSEEKTNLSKINTDSHEAFNLFLQAKAEYYALTSDGMTKSIDMLEQAIELDPEYAQAYTLLAWIHILNGQAEINADADFAVHTIEKTRPLIESSISLDSSISDNFLIMGALDLFYLNDLPSAKEHVERALRMSSWPKLPTNYCICSAISVYAALGKLEKATTLVKQSKITDRSNPFVFSDEGLILLLQGESEQAINAFKQSTEINDHPYFNYNVGWTYYHIGEFENAIHYLNKTITSETEAMGLVLAFLSNSHFKLGNFEKSYQYHDILLERQSSRKPNVNIPLAMVAAGRGETQETLRYLKKAYKEKEYGFAWFLNGDPIFDDLRGIATFIELINRVGFDQ